MSKFVICSMCLSLLLCGLALGQDQEQATGMAEWMKFAQPGEFHRKLDKMVGNWDAYCKMWVSAGNCIESENTCKYEWALGGRFLISKYQGENFEGMGILGYDNQKKKYVSIWVDTMATCISLSQGDYDEKKQTITMIGTGVDAGGNEKTFKTVTHLVSDDQHILTIYEINKDDSSEKKVMEINYQRMNPKRAYLKTLDYFVGTWNGKGKMADGEGFTDKFQCKWVQGENFLQCRYQAKAHSKLVWTDLSYWGWDAGKNEPFFTSFGMDGSIGRTMSITELDENTIVSKGHASGGMGYWRTTTRRIDDETFTITIEMKRGEEYTSFLKSTYKKQK